MPSRVLLGVLASVIGVQAYRVEVTPHYVDGTDRPTDISQMKRDYKRLEGSWTVNQTVSATQTLWYTGPLFFGNPLEETA